MADGPAVMIEQTLNDVLIRMNDHEDQKRELERDLNRTRDRLGELGREAQGLRLALFALAGQPTSEAEANKQNTKQQQELRRART